MKFILLLSTAIVLSACASGPAVPEWQMNAKGSLERATSAYLEGNDRVAAQEFGKARSAMGSTGQIALVARVELIRCASRVASLVLDECAEFELLRMDATAPERAYADYLAGRAQPQDVALLPAAHQGVMLAKVVEISDPLSRLVAAGVLLRTGRATPAVITLAVDTASAQGWRRPLMAWLGVQVRRAEQAGDEDAAQRLRRRLNLVRERQP